MIRNVIVRLPARSVINGLTSVNLGKPIYEQALVQHAHYIAALAKAGANITVLPQNEDFPDSCFVEDVALCTPRCVIISNPGAKSRHAEASLPDMKEALERFYSHFEYIKDPGTLEPGDIFRVDKHYFIGISKRTNEEGAKQMIELLNRYGYSASTVRVDQTLHLKTGASYIGHNNLLVSGEFIGREEFKGFNQIHVSDEEAYASNCIYINGRLIMARGFPHLKSRLNELSYNITELDMSEFRKIDGSLTCLSLRF